MNRRNRSRFFAALPFVILALAALACTQSNSPIIYVTATPVIVPSGEPTLPNPFHPTPTPIGPTATPLQPTPNPTYPPVNTTTPYTVASGDSLAAIAVRFGTTVSKILTLNTGLSATSIINVGQIIMLPGTPTETTPNFKIIPDSELINSPGASGFDIGAYIKFQPGFIRVYSETQEGRAMSGADIVQFVATSTSVNPRLLLALLEYRGGWISNPVPDSDAMLYPLGFKDKRFQGLFLQLNWAANTLNNAYYAWKYEGVRSLQFTDNSQLAYAPDLNPGTVAVQYFLSRTVDRSAWLSQVAPEGFLTTYMAMFGDPFLKAIEPLIPPDLKQPTFDFPFPHGETWYYTAGPHGGWDNNTGWSAIDFAPPTPPDALLATEGVCYVSPNMATAVVGGLIVRSGDGAVVIDADMDGDERTGWTILYLHIAAQDSVKAGTIVQAGDPIGHPSCQGFYLDAPATHVHVARRYNGEWIPADCWACPPGVAQPPMILSGWTIKGYPGQVYQGYMQNGTQMRKADQGRDDPDNQVSW